jgi:hypothetical protein
MYFFTKIQNVQQIEELEKKSLNNNFKFFYSLFFKLNSSRDYLIRNNLSVLFVQDGVIHAGNLDNIPNHWQEMPYKEFVKTILI